MFLAEATPSASRPARTVSAVWIACEFVVWARSGTDIGVASNAGASPQTLKRELLDTRPWSTRAELGWVVLECIEGGYNPHRRLSQLGLLGT